MSAEIHRLPDSMVRQWRGLEKVLREELLLPNVHDAVVVDYVCDQLKPIWLKYARPGAFSGKPEDVERALNDWVHQQIMGLLIELAIREIELYGLRGAEAK